jgi:hypothetical protein
MAISFYAAQLITLPANINIIRNVPGCTLCGWVKMTSHIGNSVLINISDINGAQRAQIRAVSADTIHIRTNGHPLDTDGAGGLITTVLSTPIGSWAFIAGIFNYAARTSSIYLNNLVENSGIIAAWTAGNCSDTANLLVTIGGSNALVGISDDIRIYNRILSDPEIQTIYACQGTDGIVYGLQARYLMNARTAGYVCVGGETAYDQQGNFNGTISAGCTFQESILRMRRPRARK